jgi:hypothetical protein
MKLKKMETVMTITKNGKTHTIKTVTFEHKQKI